MTKLLIIEYIVAGGIRLWLSASDFKHAISDRVEISTPLNSWKRVTEGAALYHEGTDPYMGDMFHETPIGLLAFDWMLRNVPSWLTLIFITCDLLTAFLLCMAAKLFMKELGAKQEVEKSRYASNVESLMLRPLDLRMAPLYVASAYLFNPYTILNCAGLTTTVFANLSLAAVFLTMVQARRLLCCWFLALCTLQSLYPAMLIVPVCIYIARGSEHRRLSAMLTFTCFAVTLSALLYASYHIAGSWNFLNSTYGFILNVPDLRPNIGLFWYFFTEMFEHFRLLFICAFQLNASALYLVPLSLRLHSEPMLLAASLSALTAVFKSYPSLGDVGFYLALLPMWKHLFHHMQQGFIVGCFFIVTSVLGPTVWHLWIYSRSANANFYFGVTLAFATAQIFLITDVLFAYIKREFALKHGLERTVKGKEAKLVLE